MWSMSGGYAALVDASFEKEAGHDLDQMRRGTLATVAFIKVRVILQRERIDCERGIEGAAAGVFGLPKGDHRKFDRCDDACRLRGGAHAEVSLKRTHLVAQPGVR